ncbi:phosphatase PAP2/dual specificity phosphatase family protein [Chryseobacterium arthrosphaerae]|uniref:phosphatase PAP2/dual specificity phosphatase family protein n=1 Tax=Chryseobacterium arthrosphaerae TaxID=651561 RepID=UPI001F4A9025|nr:phosphatase PAP2/dual specificity phosphatase family protein [Chryseobacterium arthrosphaerae]MDG4652241.1 phosphatase PAP2/dual specificity phosphatase family protein [Chryseobacterium arthrosphaerae]
MDEKRLTIQQRIYAFLLCTIVFAVVYNGSARYLSNLEEIPSFVFDFEKTAPFIPWTIIPYMTSGVFFCLVFFLCRNKEELKVLTQRMLFVTVTAGIGFLLFPLKFSLLKPETENSIFGYSFRFLKTFDSPFNQAPSLHIAYAFIFWSVFRNFKKGKTLVMIWLILLGISTLTTYQHHSIDLITGSILAHLCFILFPYRKNDFLYRNDQVANVYFLSGWIMILAALLLNEFSGKFWLSLLWPALMSLWVGFQYQKNNIYFLKDRKGNISWSKKVFYAPYLFIYWIFWKFFRKNRTPVEILPGIYISSRPDAEVLHNFGITDIHSVYDLSAEMEEIQALKKQPIYHSVPFLDIGYLEVSTVKKLITDITKRYTQLPENRKILIHCTMGFTRSSVIGILVMKNILSLPLEEAINTMKTINKDMVIHSYLRDFLKKF